MYKLAWIGLGGLLGTLLRYGISEWVENRAQSPFPYGTLIVNILGCFAAGFLFQSLEHSAISEAVRLGVFVGFLGGFTTFSAYGLGSLTLVRGGMPSMAVMNVLLSNVVGLAMVWVGAAASRLVKGGV
jgi:CrcB protein